VSQLGKFEKDFVVAPEELMVKILVL